MSPPKLKINTNISSEQTVKQLVPETPDANPDGFSAVSPLSRMCRFIPDSLSLRYYTDDLVGPNSTQVRSWTKGDGKFVVEAQCLGIMLENVKLLKMNGVTVYLPFTDLCQEDQQYVARTSGKTLKGILNLVAWGEAKDEEPKQKKGKLDDTMEDVFC